MGKIVAWGRIATGVLLACVAAYAATMLRYVEVGSSPSGTWIYILDRLTGTVCLTIPGNEVSRCVARGKVEIWDGSLPNGFELVPDEKDKK